MPHLRLRAPLPHLRAASEAVTLAVGKRWYKLGEAHEPQAGGERERRGQLFVRCLNLKLCLVWISQADGHCKGSASFEIDRGSAIDIAITRLFITLAVS